MYTRMQVSWVSFFFSFFYLIPCLSFLVCFFLLRIISLYIFSAPMLEQVSIYSGLSLCYSRQMSISRP